MTQSCSRQAAPLQVESDLKFLLSRLCAGNANGKLSTDGSQRSSTEQTIRHYVQDKPSCVGPSLLGLIKTLLFPLRTCFATAQAKCAGIKAGRRSFLLQTCIKFINWKLYAFMQVRLSSKHYCCSQVTVEAAHIRQSKWEHMHSMIAMRKGVHKA